MKKFYASIYHNISWPHPRKAPQRDSAASGAFPAPFSGLNPENGPDDFGAAAWLCTHMHGRDFSG